MNADAIAILVEKGLSAADILEVARALEMKKDRTGAERQARYRERHKVTRYVTRDDGSPIEDNSYPSSTDLPVEASASTPLRQPVSEAFAVWGENARAAGWSVPVLLSPDRSRLLSARLRQHGLEGWKAAIARARASPYLGGADPPSWFTFDWLIKSRNFLKLIEGNYDRRRDAENLRGSRPSPALDLLKRAAAEEAAERGDQADYRGAWPSLPAIGTG